MQLGKLIIILTLLISSMLGFDIDDYQKDGIFFFPEKEKHEFIIISHTSENKSTIKRLNRSRAKLEAINKLIKYISTKDDNRKPKTYEENHIYNLKRDINIVGLEILKTNVSKKNTKIIIRIPVKDNNIITKDLTLLNNEINESRRNYNEIPYVFYKLEISDSNSISSSLETLIAFSLNKGYVKFANILQNKIDVNPIRNILSNELIKNKNTDISINENLLDNLELYNNINEPQVLKKIADLLYEKNIKKLSMILYMHLFNDDTLKNDVLSKLSSIKIDDFEPYNTILNMMSNNISVNKSIMEWIISNNYLITASILKKYGQLSLSSYNLDYVKDNFSANNIRNKALLLFRSKNYQKASIEFMKQLEINPFDKDSISYLGYCFEKMGYVNASKILYFQSYSFDYKHNKYTKKGLKI